VSSWCHFLAGLRGLIKEVSKYFPASMGIGITEGGFLRGVFHAQMAKLAHTASQSTTYFSKALGLGQLAKEHGYKLIPGSEPLRVPLGLVSNNDPMKFNSTEQSNQLSKQACMSYHRSVLLVVGFRLFLTKL
jgi:hypothetical protein